MDQKQVQAGLQKFAEELFSLSGEDFRLLEPAELPAPHDNFREQFLLSIQANRWFVDEHIRYALKWLAGSMLESVRVLSAMKPVTNPLPVAFWIRPLTPLEGMGEIIQAALSGHRCLIKTGVSNRKMYEAIFGMMGNHIPGIAGSLVYVDNIFPEFSGMIVIGEKEGPVSESYLSRYPLLRFNYNESAIISGNESDEELRILAEDICIHFGRSARNVKVIKVPRGYDFRSLMEAISTYGWQINHSVYLNHYEYQKASMLLGRVPHLDSGHLLLAEKKEYFGRIGVLVYEYVPPGPATDMPAGSAADGIRQSAQSGRCRNFFSNADAMGCFLEKLKD